MSLTLLAKKFNPATYPCQKWCREHPCFRMFMSSLPRYNSVNIQMLSDSLRGQIFKNVPESKLTEAELKTIQAHLKRHDLSGNVTTTLPDVDLQLPPLYGGDINEHFIHIANEQLADYKLLIDEIVSNPMPKLPEKWQKTRGWTKYLENGACESVLFPDDRGLVFDVECLTSEGNYPTIATAVSTKHWYSWVSDYVLEDKFRWSKAPHLRDLIPLETKQGCRVPADGNWQPRLIIGHNVGFDRSFVKEQYFIQGTRLRFLDTMSMHIAICGLSANQRKLLPNPSGKKSHRKEAIEHASRLKQFSGALSEDWKQISSLNNLRDVHQLHCMGELLEKSKEDVFMDGSMKDVRNQFQDLMAYCAKNVRATQEVFLKLWPEFKERFPHPVTLAGMLEMGSAHLPINDAWPKYIQHSNSTYKELERELKKLLISLADDACDLLQNEQYKNDPWLWDLDWSTQTYKLNKTANSEKNVVDPFEKEDVENNMYPDCLAYEKEQETFKEYKKLIRKLYATASRVPKNPIFMPGYPTWYRELCPHPQDKDFYPGPSNISTQCRVTPKLMRLTWNGFPIHYDNKLGWGYLVPHDKNLTTLEAELKREILDSQGHHKFPLQSFLAFVYNNNLKTSRPLYSVNNVGSNDFMKLPGRDFKQNAVKKVSQYDGVGPFDIDIPGVRFYKIPHKDGKCSRVGTPLAQDYLSRAEDGTLTASTGAHVDHVLMLNKMCSYWRQSQKLIMGQMTVWLKKSELDENITRHPDYVNESLYGAIVPRIITAGTITRRAVGPTWLTGSKPCKKRVGSEVNSMIQTPPDYKFVGADVDSQELWIAAVLGDAYFMKEHGCTALGWMVLQGNKADKTDFHSKTAQIFNISREEAKAMNYRWIFGAGYFIENKHLMQFTPTFCDWEAKRKATNMYKQSTEKRDVWFMINAIEAIACSKTPMTPVLGCRISKALEPKFVLYDFLKPRIHWVVQSSAVDYLHLMLVCMRWLLTSYNIKGRYCFSIHDDVRYLVQNYDCYRAALALQITNLLTRSMFSHKLGMNDLPQSVAFFSKVNVDVCLRKEVMMDCITPSNPRGLHQGYSVPPGESLDIHEIMKRTGGKLEIS